jgi:predicted cupin superfamily sugar epimerase
MTAEDLIRLLDLRPHPREGGFFRETYRSGDLLPTAGMPARYVSQHSASTAIYYLLTPHTVSALHRLQSDEVFHFYLGDPVRMLQLFPDGAGKMVLLGSELVRGQAPQVVVPHGVWQGSVLEPGGAFALLGCTVAPSFDFADYESGQREVLLKLYPAHADMIRRLAPG